jgi:hypothetical protein
MKIQIDPQIKPIPRPNVTVKSIRGIEMAAERLIALARKR